MFPCWFALHTRLPLGFSSEWSPSRFSESKKLTVFDVFDLGDVIGSGNFGQVQPKMARASDLWAKNCCCFFVSTCRSGMEWIIQIHKLTIGINRIFTWLELWTVSAQSIIVMSWLTMLTNDCVFTLPFPLPLALSRAHALLLLSAGQHWLMLPAGVAVHTTRRANPGKWREILWDSKEFQWIYFTIKSIIRLFDIASMIWWIRWIWRSRASRVAEQS